MNVKRVLTRDEATAIRRCHHDLGSMSVESAALRMGITTHAVQGLLRSAERKAPQMFPIATPRQRAIIAMYDQDMSQEDIMTELKIGKRLLKKEVTFLRGHKLLWNRKPDQYRNWMDESVKIKF